MSQMMPQLPPELAAALGGGGGQQQPQDSYGQGGDPLQILQECIQSLPGVIGALPDPTDTQDAVKALLLLTGIQKRLMMGSNGSPGQQGG